jgi:hypothetical protein
MDRSQQSTGVKGKTATSPNVSNTSPQQAIATRSKAQIPNNPTSSTENEINNANEGRDYLEKFQLTPPIGTEPKANSLATALFYASEIKGTTRQVKNAIRSVAFILQELAIEAEAKVFTETLEKQIEREHDKLSIAVKSAIDEVKSTLETNIVETRKLMDEAIAKSTRSAPSATPSYRDALTQNSGTNKAPIADPRLLAREGIRKRQILFDVDPNSEELRNKDELAILKTLNEAIAKLDDTSSRERQLRSVRKLRNGGVLVEMRSEAAAQWLQQKEVAERLKVELKQAVSYKK